MKQIRKALGYTQEQLVENFEIGRANYSRIEKGEIFPGAPILYALRKKFHVSLDWLLAKDGHMFDHNEIEKDNKIPLPVFLDGSHEEIVEMLRCMDEFPMIKHAVLGFFIEYKFKIKGLIDKSRELDTTASHSSSQ